MNINGLEIRPAIELDSQEIAQLQRENSAANNGALSAALPEATIEQMIVEMPVIVAYEGDKLLGFLMTSSLATHADLPIIKAMLATYSGGNNAFLYGPICVSAEARNQGLAKKMFAELRPLLAGKEGILFIRNDNAPSIKAHVNMGMKLVAEFEFSGIPHSIFSFIA